VIGNRQTKKQVFRFAMVLHTRRMTGTQTAKPRRKHRLSVLALLGLFATSRPACAANLYDAVIPTRDGTTIHLADDRGKWLLINYWATWCSACQVEAPVLAALAGQHQMVVLGLSDEAIQQTDWQAFLAAHPVPYQVALVDRQALPPGIPPTFLFDEMRPISYLIAPDGHVAHRFVGTITLAQISQIISAPAN